ncbi:MAG: TonB-dependent receptor [Gammaproteobacteria bacterium]|nr:TonB-dependent receptor [Gammaproteobacteria bacterium]
MSVSEINLSNRKNKKLTQEKALKVNLDSQIYGAIVEIGAGQETARQFFSAGAAAGTVAKTMSAYDMQVSDDVYGKAGRYVSRERCEQMMRHEYKLLNKRLNEYRGAQSSFFAYAATVTARSYSQKNECHGWIGIKRQVSPGVEPSEIIMHVRMLDDTNKEQSEALGILGVNLVHGAYYLSDDPKQLINSLQDGMGHDKRIEIDLIHFSGPDFANVENRLMNLHLIHSWSCRAVMFDASGQSVVPASALRQKDTVVIRGSFKPPTKVHMDMKDVAMKQFSMEEGVDADNILAVAEITMNELSDDGDQANMDFLARVDLLNDLGFSVLISDYLRFFRLRSWIRRYTQNRIGIVLSVLDFDYLFAEQYYEGLEGGILEAFGKLFSDNTNVYVYPTIRDGKLITLENADVAEDLKFLLQHLIHNKAMVTAEIKNVANLQISAREIAKQIPHGPGDWQQSLPDKTAKTIIERELFGYSNKK